MAVIERDVIMKHQASSPAEIFTEVKDWYPDVACHAVGIDILHISR